jgi:hypothetical protein
MSWWKSELFDNFTATNGRWTFGRRYYGGSIPYAYRGRTTTNPQNVSIAIYDNSWRIVGRIRSDAEKSIINSLDFTIDEHGSANFALKLNKIPEFEILDFSIIKITLANTAFSWYCGVIDISDKEENILENNLYELRGFGFREYLKKLKVYDPDDPSASVFATGTDIGDIVTIIVAEFIVPFCPVIYLPGNVWDTTGVILANDIEVGKFFIDSVLDTLAGMANAVWGINGDGEFFFQERNTDVQKVYFAEFMKSVKPKINLQEVKNTIIVQRQQPLSAGGAGWAVGGIYSDLVSISKYGKRELQYQVPGYFQQGEIDIVGNNLLAEKKEPTTSATCEFTEIDGENSFLSNGYYRFILPFSRYRVEYQDFETLDDWALISAGDMAITLDTTTYKTGQAAIKLTYSDSAGGAAEYTEVFNKGIVKNLYIYFMADQVGKFFNLEIDVVDMNGAETLTVGVTIARQDEFVLFTWALAAYNIRRITALRIRPTLYPTTEKNIWIDRVTFEINACKHYSLDFKRATYTVAPNSQSFSAEFGQIPPKMENYLEQLFRLADEFRFTTEDRQ